MIKKILSNTVGVAVGKVGIDAANTIDEPAGKAIGTAMSGGLLLEVAGKKKERRFF